MPGTLKCQNSVQDFATSHTNQTVVTELLIDKKVFLILISQIKKYGLVYKRCIRKKSHVFSYA